MKSGIALAGVAAAVMLASSPTHAQASPTPGYRGSPYVNLDLTPDQQKQLAELRDAHDRKMLTLRDEMWGKSNELRQLWSAPKPDRQVIQKKQAEVDKIQKQMRDAGTDHRLAVLDVMTPAQREKYQAAQALGFGHGRQGRGPGFGGGGHGGPGFGGGGHGGPGRCGM